VIATPYPVPMSEWPTMAIGRKINPVTQLIEGDDTGYRRQRTLSLNPSPLVVPDVRIRAVYDGTNAYGVSNPKTALPGGVRDGQLALRETAARAITYVNQLVWEASDGAIEIVALDGFRSCYRQEQGFTRMFTLLMDRAGITPAHHLENLGAFIAAGAAADDTFAFVPVHQNAAYIAKTQELWSDAEFTEKLIAVARERSADVTPALIDELKLLYLTISANSNIGIGAGLDLNFEGNAHAGGGACDLMPMRVSDGRLLNIVPFDYPGKEAAADFMEHEGAYERYITAAHSNVLLSDHLKALG
jgi:hypothetical protein